VSTITRLIVVSMLVVGSNALPAMQESVPCARCKWLPPRTRHTVTVGSVDELVAAVAENRPSTTILLKDGEYRLKQMLDLRAPEVVLRARSGDRSKVVIRGAGMDERLVGVALSISAAHITLADLTVGYVGYHGVQVRGESGASNVFLHNVRVVDTGQQLVKVTISPTASADDGVVACSLMEYTDHAPSNYTDGVDALGAKGWVIRDNRFYRIRGPASQRWSAGPAVLFWANSIGTIVERNEIVDSFRGIALGLASEAPSNARGGSGPFDHQGGIVRNNVICNLNPWADEGIEANSAKDVTIDHNSIMVEGSLPWSISVRWPTSNARVRNNLTTRQVLLRDGGRADETANVSGAAQAWFTSPSTCDLRPTEGASRAIRSAVAVDSVTDDFDRQTRSGTTRTAGAFERSGIRP